MAYEIREGSAYICPQKEVAITTLDANISECIVENVLSALH
jgi:hypothetical protein